MKSNLFFEFDVNKETNTITVKREFGALIGRVWQAWTNAELLDQWWAAKDWKSETKSMEFKEGGMRHYVMRGPDQEVFWGITTYTAITNHQSFSGKELFADEQAVVNIEYPQSDYHIKFSELGAHTLVHHVTIYPNAEQLEASIQYGFEQGMLMAFASLDEMLTDD